MKMTTVNVLTAAYAIGNGFNDYTLVFDGALPNSGNGWKEIQLTTPFAYNNTEKQLSVLAVGGNLYQYGTTAIPLHNQFRQ